MIIHVLYGNIVISQLHRKLKPTCFVSGLLQKEYPGIAISVKTRQSIRSVLNTAMDTVHNLRGGGLLDETEAIKLEKVNGVAAKILCDVIRMFVTTLLLHVMQLFLSFPLLNVFLFSSLLR